jgi:hypothetical protein
MPGGDPAGRLPYYAREPRAAESASAALCLRLVARTQNRRPVSRWAATHKNRQPAFRCAQARATRQRATPGSSGPKLRHSSTRAAIQLRAAMLGAWTRRPSTVVWRRPNAGLPMPSPNPHALCRRPSTPTSPRARPGSPARAQPGPASRAALTAAVTRWGSPPSRRSNSAQRSSNCRSCGASTLSTASKRLRSQPRDLAGASCRASPAPCSRTNDASSTTVARCPAAPSARWTPTPAASPDGIPCPSSTARLSHTDSGRHRPWPAQRGTGNSGRRLLPCYEQAGMGSATTRPCSGSDRRARPATTPDPAGPCLVSRVFPPAIPRTPRSVRGRGRPPRWVRNPG